MIEMGAHDPHGEEGSGNGAASLGIFAFVASGLIAVTFVYVLWKFGIEWWLWWLR